MYSPAAPTSIQMLVVKVGNDERPAGPDDIADTVKSITEALKGGVSPVLVTHHAISFEVVTVPTTPTGTVKVIGVGGSETVSVPGTEFPNPSA